MAQRAPARAGGRTRGVALLYRLTVLGVVCHELAHQFVAELFGLEVREVDYTSHVVHEAPRTVPQALLVGVAPLFVNTALAAGALWYVLGAVPFDPAALRPAVPHAAALFVGFSLLFRAMPSTRDIENVFTTTSRRLTWTRPDVLVLFLLLSPVVVPMYVGLWLANATGTRTVVDLGYAALALALLAGVLAPSTLVEVAAGAVGPLAP